MIGIVEGRNYFECCVGKEVATEVRNLHSI